MNSFWVIKMFIVKTIIFKNSLTKIETILCNIRYSNDYYILIIIVYYTLIIIYYIDGWIVITKIYESSKPHTTKPLSL